MTFDFNWPQNIEISETNETKVVHKEIIIFNFFFDLQPLTDFPDRKEHSWQVGIEKFIS